MTFQGDIQTAMRDVITAFGQTWQYQSLTSAPGAALTFATAANFIGQLVGNQQQLTYQDDRKEYAKTQRATVKCSDLTVLKVGDRLIDPAGKHWHVAEIQDAADIDGIKRYVIDRVTDTKAAEKARSGV